MIITFIHNIDREPKEPRKFEGIKNAHGVLEGVKWIMFHGLSCFVSSPPQRIGSKGHLQHHYPHLLQFLLQNDSKGACVVLYGQAFKTMVYQPNTSWCSICNTIIPKCARQYCISVNINVITMKKLILSMACFDNITNQHWKRFDHGGGAIMCWQQNRIPSSFWCL